MQATFLFGGPHLHELPPGNQAFEVTSVLVREGSRLGADGLGESRQNLGVEPVGLGETASNAPWQNRGGLPGVHDGDGEPPRRVSATAAGELESAGGFEDDQGRLERHEGPHQGGDAGGVVRLGERGPLQVGWEHHRAGPWRHRCQRKSEVRSWSRYLVRSHAPVHPVLVNAGSGMAQATVRASTGKHGTATLASGRSQGPRGDRSAAPRDSV